MEAQAVHTPVRLGITAFCACQHNVKHQEGQKNSQHTDKFQHRHGRNITVFLLSCGLDQTGKHNSQAKIIADVCEVNIAIPADHTDIVKNSQAGNTAHKAKGAINRLEEQLRCSIFDHIRSP